MQPALATIICALAISPKVQSFTVAPCKSSVCFVCCVDVVVVQPFLRLAKKRENLRKAERRLRGEEVAGTENEQKDKWLRDTVALNEN